MRGGGPSSGEGGLASAFGLKLLNDAQASTRVPSTEKCSSDSSGATFSCARIAAISFLAMSAFNSRSRFFVNTVGTQTGSSIDSPTNQRNSRL